MRIDRLELRNFKKFAQATFEFSRPVNGPATAGSFHVLIGENGTGKTSILDAAAVALGSGWRRCLIRCWLTAIAV